MKIIIEDLRVSTIIGVNPDEKINKQEVSIDIHIWSDLSEGIRSDSIENTVDYKIIKKEIISYVENSSFNLLETLAYKIGKVILQDNRIRKVKVKVNKPGALTYAKNVAVEVTLKRRNSLAKAYIAIGSNIDPETNVKKALLLLKNRMRITKLSTVYLTKAIPPTQPDYYNCVVETITNLDPVHIKFEILRKIEEELGRVRGIDKYSPRTIDLDLVLYGNLVINKNDLILPDPEIEKRAFIAIPMYELNNDLVIPGLNKALKEIVKKFTKNEMIPLEDYTYKLKRELGI